MATINIIKHVHIIPDWHDIVIKGVHIRELAVMQK